MVAASLIKVFFCYERAMTGNWHPVCYHSEPPKKEKVSDGDMPSRSTVHEVPPDCIVGLDEPLFGILMKRFPAPGENN